MTEIYLHHRRLLACQDHLRPERADHSSVSEASLCGGRRIQICERFVAVVSPELLKDKVDHLLEIGVGPKSARPHKPIRLGQILAVVEAQAVLGKVLGVCSNKGGSAMAVRPGGKRTLLTVQQLP